MNVRTSRSKTLAGLLLAALTLPAAGRAQSTDLGGLQGTLLDPAGKPVARAALVLTDEATSFSLTAVSDESGLFYFPGLAPGTYQLRASASSFAALETNAVISVGTVTTMRATMPLGKATETVQVADIAPVVDTANAAFATTLDSTAVHDLPTSSRRWSDFALLTPGVTPDAAANGLLSFRGVGALLNNNTVDGADNN